MAWIKMAHKPRATITPPIASPGRPRRIAGRLTHSCVKNPSRGCSRCAANQSRWWALWWTAWNLHKIS